jgi:hypothetical protein
VSNPHIPFDPTLPVDDPIARAAELDEAWDAGYAAAEDNRSGRVAGLVLAAISGAVLGFFLATAIAHAAPRSAQLAIPVAVDVGRPSFRLPRQRGWGMSEAQDAQRTIINAAFDSFGLEEGKAILDEASRRMKVIAADGASPTLGDFGRLVEVVAIERELARVVAQRDPSPSGSRD